MAGSNQRLISSHQCVTTEVGHNTKEIREPDEKAEADEDDEDDEDVEVVDVEDVDVEDVVGDGDTFEAVGDKI